MGMIRKKKHLLKLNIEETISYDTTSMLVSFIIVLCLTGELILGFVTSKRAHGNIVSVDTSKALVFPGVRGYVDHTDVPGNNRWGIDSKEEELFASKVRSCLGHHNENNFK